jgi:hypothetical protein
MPSAAMVDSAFNGEREGTLTAFGGVAETVLLK